MSDAPIVTNAADPAQIGRPAKKRARKRREEELADIRRLLSLPEFARYVRRYLAECHVWQITHCGEFTHGTAFREGERNIGIKIFNDIQEADPTQVAIILKENAKENHGRGSSKTSGDDEGDGDDDSGEGNA